MAFNCTILDLSNIFQFLVFLIFVIIEFFKINWNVELGRINGPQELFPCLSSP